MTDPGLGPREYTVEPEHVPFLKRPKLRFGAGVLLVLAVGGGAYGVAQAFSGSPTAASAPASTGTVPPSSESPRPGAAAQNGSLRGSVTKISATAITVATRAGTDEVVTVDANTTYRSVAGASEKLADLKVGDLVAVTVAPNVTPVAAVSIEVLGGGGFAGGGSFGGGSGGAGGGRFAGATVGTVSSVATSSFVVNARAGGRGFGVGSSTTPVTVKVTATTTFHAGSNASGTFEDVKQGAVVFVTGTKNGSTVTATAVTVVPAGAFGGGGFRGGPPSRDAAPTAGGTQSS